MINLIHIAHSKAHDVFAINPTNVRTVSGYDSRDVTLNRMAMNGQNNIFTQPSVEIVEIAPTAEELDDIFSLLN